MKAAKHKSKISNKQIWLGFTLIEIIVSIGLFALIMTLAAGSYLVMINVNRQVQGIAVGINNVAFVLETMTRNIRTGTNYSCAGLGDCQNGANSFSFRDSSGILVTYNLSGSTIYKTVNSNSSALTSSAVVITSLTFYAYGTQPQSAGDNNQPRVTVVVSGTIPTGPGKQESFNIETGATMRGTDI